MFRNVASDNIFHFNKIINATEFGILTVKGDAGTTTATVGNIFENNKLINSKVNTSATTATTVLDDDNDEDDKEGSDNKDDKEKE